MKKYLFDSSSFVALIKKGDPEMTAACLKESSVTDLTFYEVGNAVWKEGALVKLITPEESEILKNNAETVLGAATRIVGEKGDFKGILQVAENKKLSFYDSSYVYFALKDGLCLVTEDRELLRKAKEYVDAVSLSSLL